MDRPVQLFVKVNGEGVERDSFGWPELKAFMDVLVLAATAMPGGPKPSEIVLAEVREGCVAPVLVVPQATARAFGTLARGPTKRWTTAAVRAAQPFYTHLRKRHLDVALGQEPEKLRAVVVPKRAAWEVREYLELRGVVIECGGKRSHHVNMDFEGDGVVRCYAGQHIVKALGVRLYEPVYVEGTACRDSVTGALLEMEIEDWRPAPEKRPGEEAKVLAELHDAIGDLMDGFDVEGFMREERS